MFYCHTDVGVQVLVVLGPALICPALLKLDGRLNFPPVQHERTGEHQVVPCPLRTRECFTQAQSSRNHRLQPMYQFMSTTRNRYSRQQETKTATLIGR